MLICYKYKQRALINSNEKLEIKVKDDNLMVVEKNKIPWSANCPKFGVEGTY